MATSRTQPTVGLGDPNILRSTESQLAQAAIIANGKSTVSDGEAIFVGTTLKVNANNVTLTTSANNQPADLVTVYRSQGATYVSAIDQTVNQTVINQVGVDAIIAGNGISISSSSASGTGTVTINSTAGNIAVVNLDGNITNVLHGDGSWSADLTTYGNSNVVTLLSAFGSNTITTTGNVSVGNVIGNGQALTGLTGANVTGFVANANIANTAFSVAAANVSGLGNIATVNLDGNASNVLRGNGTWGADANSAYGNSNVVSLLSAFGSNTIVTTGNITGGNLIGTHANGNSNVNIATANGNVTVTSNGTATWNFDTAGNLTTPGDIVGPANANFTIFSNAGVHNFTFADDGTFYAPDNVVLGGDSIYIGPGANTLTGLEHAVLIASSNHFAYIQGVINNVSDNGSADWVAQGHYGDDTGGWADIGFTSSGFGDANYTITGAGDGYVFAQGYVSGQAPADGGGNLILATGENGTTKDIIFATGGFLIANEFMRISDSNNSIELTRANASITFPDATEQNTAWTGSLAQIINGNSNVDIATANGNVTIAAVGNTTMTVTGTGANISGYANISGNITGGNINIPNGNANVTGNANTVGGGATVGVRSILAIDSAFGSNDANDPASAQAVRGRVTGSNLTKTRNYVAGVTGQYLVTGTNASEFINTGLLGVVGDQTTTANAAVVAYLDGDGGLTTAGSAYGVSMKNSTPGSGFDYGLDLQFINLNVAGTTTPFKQADIRFNNGVTLVANTAGNISINANVNLGNAVTANYFIGGGGNIAYQQTNIFYVDPGRTDTYTAIGTPIQPFKTITAAISAAVTAGYSDSNPAFILLMSNITENITLQSGIWLTSFGTGTHGSPVITGTVSVAPTSGNITSNHFALSNLRIVAPNSAHGISVTGTAPLRLFLRDIWIDANTTFNCIFMNNSQTGSVTHLNTAHLTHSGSGDNHCIDVTAGTVTMTDIETSGNIQVGIVRAGATLTMDGSEIDANNTSVIEVDGGTLTISNSLITNTLANSNGINLLSNGSVATIVNAFFSIPAGTGNAVKGVATTYLFYSQVGFAPGSNTSKTASPTLVATQLASTFT